MTFPSKGLLTLYVDLYILRKKKITLVLKGRGHSVFVVQRGDRVEKFIVYIFKIFTYKGNGEILVTNVKS